MKRNRKTVIRIISFVLAIGAMVVPTTLASAAPDKLFDLHMAPASLAGGATGATITATFRNGTPSGNSSINSVKLFANAPAGFTITGATGIGNEVVAPGGQSVSVSNIPPVKPGKSYVLTLTVNTPTQSGSTVNWSGSAWTGSSFSGDTFLYNPQPGSSVTTTISDDVLGCGDDYTESGDAGELTIVRQQGACAQGIPITIVVGEKEFDVQKPFVDGSAFRMTIAWVVEDAENPVPATKVDYGNVAGPHDMQFCLGDGADANTYPDLPANEFWCITDQTVELFETGPNAGSLQLTEEYFGAGDPKFTRG